MVFIVVLACIYKIIMRVRDNKFKISNPLKTITVQTAMLMAVYIIL